MCDDNDDFDNNKENKNKIDNHSKDNNNEYHHISNNHDKDKQDKENPFLGRQIFLDFLVLTLFVGTL